MKRAITVFSAFVVVAAVAMLAPTAKQHITSLPTVHAQGGCSDATLIATTHLSTQDLAPVDTRRRGRPTHPGTL